MRGVPRNSIWTCDKGYKYKVLRCTRDTVRFTKEGVDGVFDHRQSTFIINYTRLL